MTADRDSKPSSRATWVDPLCDYCERQINVALSNVVDANRLYWHLVHHHAGQMAEVEISSRMVIGVEWEAPDDEGER